MTNSVIFKDLPASEEERDKKPAAIASLAIHILAVKEITRIVTDVPMPAVVTGGVINGNVGLVNTILSTAAKTIGAATGCSSSNFELRRVS